MKTKKSVKIRVNPWLKISQSKTTNYAKQTQFQKNKK